MARAGSFSELGASGRRVLALAEWRSEDRALRAALSRLRELVPCTIDLIDMNSPTAVRFRLSSRTLYERMRLYDAVVFAVSDPVSSNIIQSPSERLPFSRRFVRRIPAVYLTGIDVTPAVMEKAEKHAAAWRLLPLAVASDSMEKGGDGPESLAAALERAFERN